MQIVCGIITVSDRASAGDYKDLGGPAVKEVAQKNGWQVLSEAVIPDDATKIQETIRSFSKQGCGLILTTGGTGISPRDVTPEAIRAIMRVELPKLYPWMVSGTTESRSWIVSFARSGLPLRIEPSEGKVKKIELIYVKPSELNASYLTNGIATGPTAHAHLTEFGEQMLRLLIYPD